MKLSVKYVCLTAFCSFYITDCKSQYIPINYNIRPGSSLPSSRSFQHQTDSMRILGTSEGIQTELYFMSHREFKKYLQLQGFIKNPPDNVSFPFFPVRLTIHNLSKKSYQVDYTKFEIQDTKSNQIYKAISYGDFQRNYNSDSLHFLPYNFVFLQQDRRSFLYPVPEWYGEYTQRDTSSEMEKKNELLYRFKVNENMKIHNSLLFPGRELSSVIIFELPPGKCTCILTYRNEENQKNKFLNISWINVNFELVNKNIAMKNSDRSIDLLEEEIEYDKMLRIDLLNMHRQIRKHSSLNQK